MAKTKKPAKKPAAGQPGAKARSKTAAPKASKTAKKPAPKPARKAAASAGKKPAGARGASKTTATTAKKPGKKPAARGRGVTVDEYVARQGTWQQGVIAELREILREGAPGATEQIKWGQPVYEWNGPFAHIKAFSSSVNLGFWRGATLKDPAGLLSGEGDRMKHVRITTPAGVHHNAFVALVREAVRLNDELGDPTKR